ncbi:putative ABC transport system ATP-binding protein/lipoprotein-releasing system ATP-binding protein [Austwickia chelonae]|uniref:Putative ABC transporter ATP-binding protein n=1 Tax=Austwickia chelonae NBRC 105200 TaxID=1184607 RepID=K6V7L1_9MICO|nr:ABC transporter ATP-binding protein [Austwickia chelonae]GAB78218.1 putative ABC transporter ATP-binding protein [Austwickia chelonae NBRC 105200]SEV98915.1 putative ABC transport system ATP-binding protein/lipoprotein-releasing system ATP-binding protein [Austwickia chelonae]
MSRPPDLEIRNAGVVYPTRHGPVSALDDISCSFEAGGSTTAIVGRSGAGKSTLVSVLALMRTPTTGQVFVNGVAVPTGERARTRIRAATIGMVFQSFHLDPAATALQNVLLPWHFNPRLSRRAARAQAVEVFDRLGVAELLHRPVSAMSGGQRQRVAIARAMASQPRVLVADEPTGNLDEETGNAVAADLYALKEIGTTVIVVSHDAAVAAMADRMLHLSRGRLTVAAGGLR